jgi:hypothetical protein
LQKTNRIDAAPRPCLIATVLLAVLSPGCSLLAATDNKPKAPAPAKAPAPPPDVIIFNNGDRLSGKLVRAVDGTVTFHSDLAGDINVSWDKIKELHAAGNFAVLEKGVIPKRKLGEGQISIGAPTIHDQKIDLAPTAAATRPIPSIPTANAAYLIDQPTLDKELLRTPGLFEAWNGSTTGGVTLVKATQNQYTVNTAVTLVRLVPTVPWLAPRNRTTLDFNSSFGKLTEPAFTDATGVFNPATETKTNILHGDAEQDEYFSPRFYYLAELSLDHNFAQSLQLQQVYGLGIGWTAIKRPKQQLDLKIAAQYESQKFFDATAGSNQNLIGATIGASYLRKLPRGIVFNQQVDFLPAFNNPHAFSATETDTLTFPAYKNLGFTIGSLDSYLNNAPVTLPATQRNSFQFTIGATYAIKSKY